MELMTMDVTRALVLGLAFKATILLTLGLIVICTWCSRASHVSQDPRDH